MTPPPVPRARHQAVRRQDLLAARRGFGELVPALLAARGARLDARSAACLALGGLFEALSGA